MLASKADAVIYLIKSVRFLAYWIIWFIVDKVLQDAYVQNVYIQYLPAPNIKYVGIVAVAAESVVFLALFVCTICLKFRYDTEDNAFIVTNRFVQQLFVDFVMTAVLISMVSYAVARVTMDEQLLRYDIDGLRGIRATTTIIMVLTGVILACPFYSIA